MKWIAYTHVRLLYVAPTPTQQIIIQKRSYNTEKEIIKNVISWLWFCI